MRRLLLLLILVPQDPGTLRLAWTPPATLDPAKGRSMADARVLSALFEGLTTFEADHRTPAPGAAERWTVSDDGLTWTFFLRDAKWSDGEPVTAGDFVFAWKRLLEPGAAFPDAIRTIRNVPAYVDAQRAAAAVDDLEASQGLDNSLDGRTSEIRFVTRAGRKNLIPKLERMVLRASGEVKKLLQEALAAAKTRDEILLRDLGIAAVDAKTLRLTLEHPAPWLLDSLAFMALYPVPEKSVRAIGAKWADPRIIATNGPYRIEKSDPRSMTLARVRGGGPEKVVLEWCQPDDAMRLFDQKKADWLDGDTIPPKLLTKVAESDTFHYQNLWGTWFLRLNVLRDPFKRPDARRAFAHATDRAPLVPVVRMNPASGLVPEFAGYRGASAPKFGRGAAIEALLKAYPDITLLPQIELLCPEDARAAAEAIQKQWEKNLGVKVRILGMKGPAYAKALGDGKFDAALGAWAGDYHDPAAFLEIFTRDHFLNVAGWSSDAFDARLAKARAELDLVTRLGLLAECERQLVAEEVVVVPLYFMGSYQLVSPRVRGVAPNPWGRVLLQHVRL